MVRWYNRALVFLKTMTVRQRSAMSAIGTSKLIIFDRKLKKDVENMYFQQDGATVGRCEECVYANKSKLR